MRRNTLRFAVVCAAALGMSSACASLVGDFDFGTSTSSGSGTSGGTGGTGGVTSTSSHGSSGSTSSGMACSPPDCNDNNPCTKDTCSMGVCSHTNEASGTTCGTSLICDGNGKCTDCTDASQCGAGNPCAPFACVTGTCTPQPITAGMPCMGMAGVCDATAMCVTCLDQAPPPAPGCMGMDYCFADACVSCTDTVANGDETDVDCGGAHCGPCADLHKCKTGADCTNMHCDAAQTPNVCISCMDGSKNGAEADVDCGGICPTKCALTKGCVVAPDCASNECTGGKCTACHDGTKNGDETGNDCGGSCGPCGSGNACNVGGDCASGNCVENFCCDSTCTNMTSGTKCESCALPGYVGTCTKVPSGVDGSPSCGAGNLCDGTGVCQGTAKKRVGVLCTNGGECFNGNCALGACRLKPGDYCNTSVECDTDFCSPQHKCAACSATSDCASNICTGGKCKLPGHAVCGSGADCAIGGCVSNFCSEVNTLACTTDADCATNFCKGNQCAPCVVAADCATGPCTMGNCLGPPGDGCLQDTDCAGNLCGTTAASPLFKQCH